LTPDSVFAPADPACSGQVEDETAIHLGIELEVEVVQLLIGVTELGLLVAPFQQSLTATGEFVRDRHGIRSMGAMTLACACRRRVSSTATCLPGEVRAGRD